MNRTCGLALLLIIPCLVEAWAMWRHAMNASTFNHSVAAMCNCTGSSVEVFLPAPNAPWTTVSPDVCGSANATGPVVPCWMYMCLLGPTYLIGGVQKTCMLTDLSEDTPSRFGPAVELFPILVSSVFLIGLVFGSIRCLGRKTTATEDGVVHDRYQRLGKDTDPPPYAPGEMA